ncbi:hypothetical protein ACJIZ3_015875 [Penstemon smallii]|uniref:Uncharacterized protein n=1 Tax=Penstemon smallii TaxID=265156 RepID=A0ABD3RNR7_9LAMI
MGGDGSSFSIELGDDTTLMQIKSDHPTTAAAPASTACVQCGAKERWLLHNVRHRGVFRRLCTTCVLRLHPQSFCPTCFQVYPPPPSNDAVLSCFKCYSSTHSHCVASPAPTPYICTLCANPTGPIFKLKTAKDSNVVINEGEGEGECRVMDGDAAKKLLAAAKISAVSMNKAAVAAKAEAERRAKEAAFARKRAKEALEHVAFLVVKDKLRKKEVFSGTPGDVSGSGGRGGGNGILQVKRENIMNVVNSGSRNGIVSSTAGPSVVVEENISAVGKTDRVENSNQVLAALNAVELRENEKTSGTKASSVEMGVPIIDDRVSMMDVDESGRMGASVGGLIVEKNNGSGSDHIISNNVESGAENLNKQVDVNNEVVLASSVVDRVQNEENNTGKEKQANGTPQ